jgi:transposase
MARIPLEVTKAQFEQHFLPHLSTAKRGYVSEIPLYKIFNYILYKLRTGCQWEFLPMDKTPDGVPEASYQVPSYHFRKWSRDGSLQDAAGEPLLSAIVRDDAISANWVLRYAASKGAAVGRVSSVGLGGL